MHHDNLTKKPEDRYSDETRERMSGGQVRCHGIRVVQLCTAVLAYLLLALPVAADTPTEWVPGAFDADTKRADQAELARTLLLREGKATVTVIEVQPDPAELERIAASPVDSGRLLVGTVTPAGIDAGFAAVAERAARGLTTPHAGGVLRLDPEGLTWTAAVRSPGATALRLHFTDFSLPRGVELFVYNERGEAHGPYIGLGVMKNGDFWSHTVSGDTIRVQLQVPASPLESDLVGILSDVRLEVAAVVHLGERFEMAHTLSPQPAVGDKALCSFNASCVENASCSSIPSAIQPAAAAVAHLQFTVGSDSFICSGGLVNDTDHSTTIPYLLTANHCFSSSSSASSLEAFFGFTTSCGGSCSSAGSPRILGSTLLATDSTSDYTLVQLNSGPPAGSTLLGWSTTAVAESNGTHLFRISHPGGAPQAYSEHEVDTSAGTCGSLPRGAWIYSRDTFGATESGSSGSPVLNSNGQIVGQLTGACGTNTGDTCDSVNNGTVDGALASYFFAVREWLDPSATGCVPSSTVFCAGEGGRFRVSVEWQDFAGVVGDGRVLDLGRRDSGIFWFFGPENLEMLVKVLDGCGVNDHFWVFAAATTTVRYTLTVTDLSTGEVAVYENPLGVAPPAITDTGAFGCS